jgi:DNA (cytosine-5)-methyltransferase 1
VLSLFAGIGGFDLGLERAGFSITGQCEIDPFCRKVLEKHWPHVWRHDDVRTLTGQLVSDNCGRIDVICGGFPCQDISNAGRCAGIDGGRSGLWSEFARLIGDLRPKYVIVENVAALLGRGMGRVLGDLAACGLDAEWDCLPANAFGVRQARNRCFIVAYPHRRQQPKPYERTILRGKVAPSPFIDGQPVPNGMRVTKRASDGLDVARRISACANIVIPQVAEWIGHRIMERA